MIWFSLWEIQIYTKPVLFLVHCIFLFKNTTICLLITHKKNSWTKDSFYICSFIHFIDWLKVLLILFKKYVIFVYYYYFVTISIFNTYRHINKYNQTHLFEFYFYFVLIFKFHLDFFIYLDIYWFYKHIGMQFIKKKL